MTDLLLALPTTKTFDDWSDLGRKLCMAGRAINWLIGDWIIEGSERFGEKARDEANRIFQSDRDRLHPIVQTCRNFPPERRHEALTFSHHQAVEKLVTDKQPEEADRLLGVAERARLPVRDLARIVVEQRITTGALFPRIDDDPTDTEFRGMVQHWNRSSNEARALFAESVAASHLEDIEL